MQFSHALHLCRERVVHILGIDDSVAEELHRRCQAVSRSLNAVKFFSTFKYFIFGYCDPTNDFCDNNYKNIWGDLSGISAKTATLLKCGSKCKFSGYIAGLKGYFYNQIGMFGVNWLLGLTTASQRSYIAVAMLCLGD